MNCCGICCLVLWAQGLIKRPLLCFHTNFRIIYSSSVKNAIGTLIGIALNLQIALGSRIIFTMLILRIQEHGISLHLFVSSLITFISVLYFSAYRSFVSLGMFIPRCFLLFVAMLYGSVSLISLSDFHHQCIGMQRFLCINFISCYFTKFIDYLQQFSGSIFWIIYVQYHVICKQ